MELNDYLSLFIEYKAETNTYELAENLLGTPLGTLKLVEGPGWVFSANPLCLGIELDYTNLYSITELISDLNSLLN